MRSLYYKIRGVAVTWLLRLLPRNQGVVFAGAGSSLMLSDQALQLGHRRILVVTDAFLAGSGLLDDILKRLRDGGAELAVYDGVEPDPLFEQVEAGVRALREHQVDAVFAIGGGSVLDAAKLIALAANNPGDLAFFDGIQKAKRPGLPLFALPTTAGTGSETTPASVITESGTKRKVVVADGKLVPHYVALDAGLMRTMPPRITAATGMDALTHAVESWLSKAATDATRDLAAAATRAIFEHLPRAFRDGDDMEAREAMAMASFQAGVAFGRTSVGYAHAVAHQLGRICGTPHGEANAMVLPEVLESYGDTVVPALTALARRVAPDRPDADHRWLIGRVRELRSELGLPLKPEGLESAHLDEVVRLASREAGEFYPVPRYFDAGTIRGIAASLL
jgi:alcohol dehydrogenase class IV